MGKLKKSPHCLFFVRNFSTCLVSKTESALCTALKTQSIEIKKCYPNKILVPKSNLSTSFSNQIYEPRSQITKAKSRSSSKSESFPFERKQFSNQTLTAKIVTMKWQRIASASIDESNPTIRGKII